MTQEQKQVIPQQTDKAGSIKLTDEKGKTLTVADTEGNRSADKKPTESDSLSPEKDKE